MADNFTPAVKRLLRDAGCRFERQGDIPFVIMAERHERAPVAA
jgi:hypothetical protein